jgi:hypothetical protein
MLRASLAGASQVPIGDLRCQSSFTLRYPAAIATGIPELNQMRDGLPIPHPEIVLLHSADFALRATSYRICKRHCSQQSLISAQFERSSRVAVSASRGWMTEIIRISAD